MGFSRWLCTNTSKHMVVKIVHPGGHIELYDRPILASEIMSRNSRCFVTYPYVFQQPWAILEPNSTLKLGQKFYIVPISTISKLQRAYLKHSPISPSDGHLSPNSQDISNKTSRSSDEEETRPMISSCWFFSDLKAKHSSAATPNIGHNECLSLDSNDDNDNEKRTNNSSNTTMELMEKEGFCWDDDSCFMCFNAGVNSDKETPLNVRKETTTISTAGNRNRRKKDRKILSSPKRCTSFDNWQPSLESIREE